MNCEQALVVANEAVYKKTGKYLTDVQTIILKEAWNGLGYEEIAITYNYTEKYLRQDVGAKLWKLLTEAIGEKVSKKNCRTPLERRYSLTINYLPAELERVLSIVEKEFPNHLLIQKILKFYLEIYSIQQNCCHEILKPGSLIRIKGRRKNDKTSLLQRTLQHAKQSGYQTVRVDCQEMDSGTFDSPARFFKQLCANVTTDLGIKPEFDRFWDDELFGGPLNSTTTYFQGYLLKKVTPGLVLAFDEFDRLFEHPIIAEKCFNLLRNCHEEVNNYWDIWQKLRLVIVHSKEPEIKFDINKSPFNVGLPIQLPEFDLNDVLELTGLCGLN